MDTLVPRLGIGLFPPARNLVEPDAPGFRGPRTGSDGLPTAERRLALADHGRARLTGRRGGERETGG
jgi:hypothetical protein